MNQKKNKNVLKLFTNIQVNPSISYNITSHGLENFYNISINYLKCMGQEI